MIPVPMRVWLPAAALAIAGAVAAPAQDQPQPVPEPYDATEFAPALRHLRRAEIVAVGSFPFALLVSTIVYDYARWAGEGFAETASPFRRPLDEDPFDDDEKVGIALAAAGVAVAVAVADYLIGQAAAEPRFAVTPRAPRSGLAGAESTPAAAYPGSGLLPPSLATLWWSAAAAPPAAVALRPARDAAPGAGPHG